MLCYLSIPYRSILKCNAIKLTIWIIFSNQNRIIINIDN